MSMYQRERPQSFPGIVLAYVLLLIAVGFLVWRFWPEREHSLDPEAKPRPVAPRAEFPSQEKANIELVKNASPSVAHITSVALRRDFFTLDVRKVKQGTGSGIVWDEEGHVVTNYHVVKDGQAAQVVLADQSSWSAKKVFYDPDTDLAVVWIDAPKSRLKPIPLGKSSTLQVGQFAFAIGNPFGLDNTVTHGIISALGREIDTESGRTIKGMIQTDAPINPGNSGGALLDSAGRLIGINTAIFSPSGASAGIGFAIPADEVNRVVTELIRHGKIERPSLGIQELPDQLAQRWGISSGVLILNVTPGGPAARAGLRPTRRDEEGDIVPGDIIVSIDSKAVKTANQLHTILDRHHVGDEVTVTVLRGDQRLNVKLTLAAARE